MVEGEKEKEKEQKMPGVGGFVSEFSNTFEKLWIEKGEKLEEPEEMHFTVIKQQVIRGGIIKIEETRKPLKAQKFSSIPSEETGGMFLGEEKGEKERSKEPEEPEEPDMIETKLELEEMEDDFYKKLAREINRNKIKRGKVNKTETKKEHFEKQIDALIPVLERTLETIKNLSHEKQETVEKMLGMLISLQSLRKNQSRYTAEHLAYRLNEVLKMVVRESDKRVLKDALENIVADNVYNESKGKNSVPFDVRKIERHFSAPEEEKIKRVKVEHDERGEVVYGAFTYDRKTLFNEGNTIIAKDEKYKDFRDQIEDFVNVAIHEYRKGTQKNPIVIIFKGSEQPEAALALLLEYKKRAIMEGKDFYALHEGKEVVITSKTTSNGRFTNSEIDYFLHYANKKPEIPNKDGKKDFARNCAGYSFLVNENASDIDENHKQAITRESLEILLIQTMNKENFKKENRSAFSATKAKF